jgi:hypothetical protein
LAIIYRSRNVEDGRLDGGLGVSSRLCPKLLLELSNSLCEEKYKRRTDSEILELVTKNHKTTGKWLN